jgi:hypothetical protein
MATSRRNPDARASGSSPARRPERAAPRTGPAADSGATATGAGQTGTDQTGAGQAGEAGELNGSGRHHGDATAGLDMHPHGERLRMPPVRLAPREELAGAARVAPLLRAARDLNRWLRGAAGLDAAGLDAAGLSAGDLAESVALSPEHVADAAAELEMAPSEVEMAWQVARAAASETTGGVAAGLDSLTSADAEEVLALWDSALQVTLAAEDLDGLATALYTVGAPVRMESLFDAYAAAAGTQRPQADRQAGHGDQPQDHDQAAALSRALETLADLGVVELGTEEAAGGLTVALSPLGVWGVHRRLRSQGWHVPVLGSAGRAGAAGLLATLASCDAEDGEAEIGTWLASRTAARAAAELVSAARTGSPGLRGAAFAVLDRVGAGAIEEVRAALAEPLLRAHAAVWLHEHGEEAELTPDDRTWLLVDLGAGLLEEADPRDVVAELLPEVPARTQAEIVASLWKVSHPGVTGLLTALGEHHPDPAVARAARKAAFKARSPSAGTGRADP